MELIHQTQTATEPTLFESLRQETADLHKEIESYVPLLNPKLSLGEYRTHLRKLLGFYIPLEEQLARFSLPEILEMPKRFKKKWLIADLIALGESPESFARIPLYADINQITSISALVGALYVTEGSTLGGQVIHRALKENLQMPDSQMRFYMAYGSDTGRMWNLFKTHAPKLVPDREKIVAGESARETFKTLIHWLKTN